MGRKMERERGSRIREKGNRRKRSLREYRNSHLKKRNRREKSWEE